MSPSLFRRPVRNAGASCSKAWTCRRSDQSVPLHPPCRPIPLLKGPLSYLLLSIIRPVRQSCRSARLRSNSRSSLRSLLRLCLLYGRNRASILLPFDADRLPDPAPIHTLGSTGPSFLDHDTRGDEPLDCGIVEAVLAQHLVCVLREFGWR